MPSRSVLMLLMWLAVSTVAGLLSSGTASGQGGGVGVPPGATRVNPASKRMPVDPANSVAVSPPS